MLCKKRLISIQHHAVFDSPTVITSGGKKDHIYSNSDSDREENKSSDTH